LVIILNLRIKYGGLIKIHHIDTIVNIDATMLSAGRILSSWQY